MLYRRGTSCRRYWSVFPYSGSPASGPAGDPTVPLFASARVPADHFDAPPKPLHASDAGGRDIDATRLVSDDDNDVAGQTHSVARHEPWNWQRATSPPLKSALRMKELSFSAFCFTSSKATVSRTTSSMVVTPPRILWSPDSRRLIIPSSIAFFLNSRAEAPIRINSRISSVTSITS